MNLLLMPGLIVAAAVVLGFVLWRAGALTPPPVSAWNRVGRNHGLIDDRPLTERLGERAPFMRSFDDVANIPKLLTIAGRTESATAWVLRTVALSVLVMLAGFAMELVGFASRGELPFPLIYCVGLAVVAFLVGYLLLRVAAKRRQQSLQAGLGGALTELAILTYNHQMSIENALDLLARSQVDPTLWGLLRDDEWRKLVVLESSRLVPFRAQPFVSAGTLYGKVGHAYGVPMFALLGGTMGRMGLLRQPAADVRLGAGREPDDRLADRAGHAGLGGGAGGKGDGDRRGRGGAAPADGCGGCRAGPGPADPGRRPEPSPGQPIRGPGRRFGEGGQPGACQVGTAGTSSSACFPSRPRLACSRCCRTRSTRPPTRP